ncbi:MAG: efflux RND transporter permease subunit [Steroidobacteraceae bacterium]
MSAALPPPESAPRTTSIMNRIVASSLRQGLLIAVMALLLVGAGSRSLQRLPVDAYPDLSPPMVEIITQWPGRASEEVERLITVPVERQMNGIPRVASARSISLYGLSDVILTFQDKTDNDFARQEVFNRLGGPVTAERRYPVGLAHVGAVGAHLSLRAAKSRPLTDGAQDLRGLDRRAAVQVSSGCSR